MNETRPLDAMGAATVLVSWLSLMLLNPDPVAIGFFVAALGFTLARGRLHIPRLLWLIFTLAAVVGSVALLQAADPKTSLARGLLSPTLYPACVALGAATLPALLRRHTRREYWFTLSLSGVFYLFCGLNLSPLTAQFGVLAALWTICFCLSTRYYLTGTRPSWTGYLTFVPTMVLLGLAAYLFALSEQQFAFLLRFLNAGNDVSLAFPAQNRLGTMMATETNPAVVARCFGLHPSTYLGARVYVHYRDGIWTEFDKSSNVEGQPVGNLYRYPLTDQPKAGQTPPVQDRYEVHASPIVLFAPRDGAWLDVKQTPLALLSGHLLESRGGAGDVLSYTVARWPDQDLAPAESQDYLKGCLELPGDLNPIVAETARQVCGEGPARQKGLRCVEWFHGNFKYGFGHDFASEKDPIGNFLIHKPQAHCEVFAATMTLMMRSQGIPARYVNGFVCVEQSWSGYYVIRVRDAHAWVEIWDGQAWRSLDPTPPTAIQPARSWSQWLDELREAINYYSRSLGFPSPRKIVSFVWQHRRWFGLLLVGVGLWKLRRAPWLPRSAGRAQALAQHTWIKSLTGALAVHGLARHHWETLLSWAARLREAGQAPVADWLEQYNRHRYGGEPEGDLAPRLNELLRSLQNPPS